MKKIVLLLSHGVVGFLGFALGIYLLPVLTAQQAPAPERLERAAERAEFHGEFRKDLRGSDWLHWGTGTISLSAEQIIFQGELAPGPDYKLYLSPQFVEDEASFVALKPQMVQIADVRGFDGFMFDLPKGLDLQQYNTVVIWCESFGEFITAARYR
ncbi:DM13 domain-containing protein [Neptuniibacter halophilus]|uniref:DM13 domain-containing protein n=1 Tax=Neptuniibacter halophilus TaxID=651666 RepID=UPI00257275A6|nr:DM13 domain-containing protein [Neptuniibacter halophilus]